MKNSDSRVNDILRYLEQLYCEIKIALISIDVKDPDTANNIVTDYLYISLKSTLNFGEMKVFYFFP